MTLSDRISSAKFIMPNWSLTPALRCFAFTFLAARSLARRPSCDGSPAHCLGIGAPDLEPPKQSALGVYVKRYMTLAMQLLRICGFLVMAVAAWNHAPLAILAGLTVVAAGWAQRRDCRLNRSATRRLGHLGLLLPRSAAATGSVHASASQRPLLAHSGQVKQI